MKKKLNALLVLGALLVVGCGKSSDDTAAQTNTVAANQNPYSSVNGGTCVPLAQANFPYTANNIQANSYMFYAPQSAVAVGVGGGAAGITFNGSSYAGNITLSIQNYNQGAQNGQVQTGPLVGSGMMQLSPQIVNDIAYRASGSLGGGYQNGQQNGNYNPYNPAQSLCLYGMELRLGYQFGNNRIFGDVNLYVGTTDGRQLGAYPIVF